MKVEIDSSLLQRLLVIEQKYEHLKTISEVLISLVDDDSPSLEKADFIESMTDDEFELYIENCFFNRWR